VSARLQLQVSGAEEAAAALATLAGDYPRIGALACDQAMQLVITWVKPKVPRRTGRTVASLSTRVSATSATITAAAPQFGWLDYGGAVGRKLATIRQYRPGGRYLQPGVAAREEAITAAMEALQTDAARSAGLA
jgi:hypothetical protein